LSNCDRLGHPQSGDHQTSNLWATRLRFCRYGYAPFFIDCPAAHDVVGSVKDAVAKHCRERKGKGSVQLPNTNLDAYHREFLRAEDSSGTLLVRLRQLASWAVAHQLCASTASVKDAGSTRAETPGKTRKGSREPIDDILCEAEAVGIAAIEALGSSRRALGYLLPRRGVAEAYRAVIENIPPPCCKSIPMDEFAVAGMLTAVTLWDEARRVKQRATVCRPVGLPEFARPRGETFWLQLLSLDLVDTVEQTPAEHAP